MELNTGLTLIGLVLITWGSLGAAIGAPNVKINADGSTSLSEEPNKARRIKKFKRQNRVPFYFGLIAIGAFTQAVALFVC